MWLPAPEPSTVCRDEAQCTSRRLFSHTPPCALFLVGIFLQILETSFPQGSAQRPSCPRNLNYPVSCILPPNKSKPHPPPHPIPDRDLLHHAAKLFCLSQTLPCCLIPTLAQEAQGAGILGLSCLCTSPPHPSPELTVTTEEGP